MKIVPMTEAKIKCIKTFP